MASRFIWSASRLKSYYLCAKRFKEDKFVETQEVRDGKERHSIVESAYVRGDLDVLTFPPDAFTREQLLIVDKAAKRGYLPPLECVLSVEGRDLPPEFQSEAYGRPLFLVECQVLPNGDTWALRGAADLVFIDPEDPDTLWIADWKSRSQDDGDIQGSCYAIAYSKMFPGFKKYVFQQRSLTLSWPHDTYEFLAEDLPSVIDFIGQIGMTMESDTTFAPSENKWCNYCGIKDSCPVWLKMSGTPIVESLPAVKTFLLPVAFGELLELKERAANYEKIAEGLKDRCNEALMKILDAGPQKHEGKIYTKGKGVNRYDVKAGKLEPLLVVLEKAGAKVEDLFKLDASEAREVLQSAEKKTVNAQLAEEFKTAIKELFEPRTYDKINRKAG